MFKPANMFVLASMFVFANMGVFADIFCSQSSVSRIVPSGIPPRPRSTLRFRLSISFNVNLPSCHKIRHYTYILYLYLL